MTMMTMHSIATRDVKMATIECNDSTTTMTTTMNLNPWHLTEPIYVMSARLCIVLWLAMCPCQHAELAPL
jgi:hypothetical protein